MFATVRKAHFRLYTRRRNFHRKGQRRTLGGQEAQNGRLACLQVKRECRIRRKFWLRLSFKKSGRAPIREDGAQASQSLRGGVGGKKQEGSAGVGELHHD